MRGKNRCSWVDLSNPHYIRYHEALGQDLGIVRNKLKISAAVHNVRAFRAIQQEWGALNAVSGTGLRRFIPEQSKLELYFLLSWWLAAGFIPSRLSRSIIFGENSGK